jgi:hypothetical protein
MKRLIVLRKGLVKIINKRDGNARRVANSKNNAS